MLGNYFLASKENWPELQFILINMLFPISRSVLKATYRCWWRRHWSLNRLLSVSLPWRSLWFFIFWFSNNSLQLLQFFIFDPKFVLHLQLLCCYTTLLQRQVRTSMKYVTRKHKQLCWSFEGNFIFHVEWNSSPLRYKLSEIMTYQAKDFPDYKIIHLMP